jgi:hypothetical protein
MKVLILHEFLDIQNQVVRRKACEAMKIFGVGTIVAGLIGVALHAFDAVTAVSLLFTVGFGLPPMFLAQCLLGPLSVVLFFLFAIGGIGMCADEPWGRGLIQRMTSGLVLISGLSAIALYLKTLEPSGSEGAFIAWAMLVAHILAGIVWPVVFVAVMGGKPTFQELDSAQAHAES